MTCFVRNSPAGRAGRGGIGDFGGEKIVIVVEDMAMTASSAEKALTTWFEEIKD